MTVIETVQLRWCIAKQLQNCIRTLSEQHTVTDRGDLAEACSLHVSHITQAIPRISRVDAE